MEGLNCHLWFSTLSGFQTLDLCYCGWILDLDANSSDREAEIGEFKFGARSGSSNQEDEDGGSEIGEFEWSAQQITVAWSVAHRLDLVGPIAEQPEYNLLSRHKVKAEFQPLYSNYGIGLTTWSLLASGVLTGKYTKGTIPPESRFSLDNYKNQQILG